MVLLIPWAVLLPTHAELSDKLVLLFRLDKELVVRVLRQLSRLATIGLGHAFVVFLLMEPIRLVRDVLQCPLLELFRCLYGL